MSSFRIVLILSILYEMVIAAQFKDIAKTENYIKKNYTIRYVDLFSNKTIFLYGKYIKVGCINYTLSPDCSISYLLSPEQHQGIGTWLIFQALRDMKTSGCQNTCIDSVKEAKDFYQKLGFIPLNNSIFIRMSRSLDDI